MSQPRPGAVYQLGATSDNVGQPGSRPRVILGTSNGTGMGHLARQAATALAFRGRAEPVIFSMSLALPLVFDLGVQGEYCPSYHRGFIPYADWHRYLAERVCAIVRETGARVFAFDGVAPYYGLVIARTKLPDVAFVWVRRAMWQPRANTVALRSRHFFDLVLEPGDLAAAADRGATAALDDAVRIPPVTLLGGVTSLSRAEAAGRLGLDPTRPAALVTLRTESLMDDTPAAVAMRTLLSDPNWQVAVTRTPITPDHVPGLDSERIVPIRGVFPLASYLSAFDAAVVEAGYNSFHEVIHAGLPAVLVPTSAAVTDDQVERARWAAGAGLALVAAEDDPSAVAAATAQLLDPAVRAELSARCAQLSSPSGASAAADALADLAVHFDRHRPVPAERLRRADFATRSVAGRLLGRPGRAAVRGMLGRAQETGPARRLAVQLRANPPVAPWAGGVPPLLVTDKVSSAELREGYPVEHVLHGTSARYRAERERIVRRYFDVQA